MNIPSLPSKLSPNQAVFKPFFMGVSRFLYMYEVCGWRREEGKNLIDAHC